MMCLTFLQIINYLRANAHPEMLKRVSYDCHFVVDFSCCLLLLLILTCVKMRKR